MTDYMDSAAVAELLHCEPSTVDTCARTGRLPAVQFGKCWIFPREALLKAINQLALDEARVRSTPARAAAVKVTPVKKHAGRPNLALLTQASA